MPFITIVSAYVLTGKLGLLLAIPPGVATPVWPPSGIALAALLISGRKYWPAVFLGSFLLNFHILATSSASIHWGIAAVLACSFAMASSLQAIVGVVVVRRWLGTDLLRGPFSVLGFAALATVTCGIASSVGALAPYLAGLTPSTALFAHWFTWWLGDYVGLLLFAPPILFCWDRKPLVLGRWEVAERLGIAVALAVTCLWVFGESVGVGRERYPLDFLLVLPLLLAGLRLQPLEISVCVLAMSAFVLAGTHAGLGPFVRATMADSLLFAQAFVGISAIAVLTLNALLRQRELAQLQALAAHAKLAAANRELQVFTYGVSHDLKEPLRSISSQMQFLEDRYGDRLGADAAALVHQCIGTSARMSQLIDDLMQYAQADAAPLNLGQVDVAQVFQRVVSDLKSLIDATRADIRVNELPVLVADELLVHRLAQNLLHNAIKFGSRQSTPCITVTAKKVDEVWNFQVQDNGIGFDMSHGEQIFEPFVRLHGRDFYHGSGIGLALCKKIVERHGGRIWAKSSPGRGALFVFTFA